MKKYLIVFLLTFISIHSFAQENKMFWIDRSGNPVNYPGDYTDEDYDGIALYRENGKYGCKDVVGNVKIEARYDIALNLGKGFTGFAYTTSDAWFIFNRDGKMIHGSPFKKIHSLNDSPEEKPCFINGLLAIESISIHKMGAMDTTGKIVIPEIYDYIKDHGDPVLYIGKDGKHGIMDIKSKEEKTTKYDEINEFSEGLAAVSKGGKWGYINYDGKEVISLKYTSAGFFINNQAAIMDAKTSAKKFINAKGDFVEKSLYSWETKVNLIYEEVMVVKNESQKSALFDRSSGKQLTDFIYINDPVFVNGFAVCIDSENKASLMNEQGKAVLKGYDGFGMMHEGLVCAIKKESVKDATGATVAVEKCGYVDLEGNVVIPFNYGGIGQFHNGIAQVVRYEDYKDYKLKNKK